MGAVEEALAPGEEVRFEGAARGWPPFSLDAAAVYSACLLPLLLLTAAGGLAVAGMTIGVSPDGLWPVSMPLWLVAVGLVAAVETWRVVSFRSTVHAITTSRVLTLRGVVRVRPRAQLTLTGGETVTLVDGDPCVQGAAVLRLVGLGAENFEAVRLAVGLPPEPAPPALLRRRRGVAFALVALLLLGAAQVVGALASTKGVLATE